MEMEKLKNSKDIDQLISDFKEKTKLEDDKDHQKALEKREARKVKRDAGEEASDDTVDSDHELPEDEKLVKY